MSKKKSKYGGKYSLGDAIRDTLSSNRKGRQAWHDARDHASKEKGWGLDVFKKRNRK